MQATLSKFYYYYYYYSFFNRHLVHDLSKYLPDGQHEYWGSNYPRLQQIKTELDPQDVFSNPQSVRPL